MSAVAEAEISIGPQPGPQEDFLKSPADIAIYGGAAGGGKSYALLLEPLRHWDNKLFGAVIFRRNATQVRNEGGLWQESLKLYTPLGANPREYFLEHQFPSGMRVKFAHLEDEKAVFDWQGSQIAMIGFDELTHFSETQFFYMLSRNRSDSGVPGYVRATCNPDPDSWVRKFIDWWIGKDGFPIPERSGVLRWFIRINDEIHWADTRDELARRFQSADGDPVLPKSVTFIPSKIYDNKILLAKDPGYLANLNAMTRVDRARLKDGNWNIRVQSGDYFQRHWFPMVKAIPAGWTSAVRYWDRAATRVTPEKSNPDWTRGVLVFKYPNGRYVVGDVRSLRGTPHEVERLIVTTASHDTPAIPVMAAQDPGSAGVAEKMYFVAMLAGYIVDTEVITKDKETRAKPVSSQAEAGNISVVEAPWNDEFFKELEAFPNEKVHDDQVDALSGAFNRLRGDLSILDAC